MQIHKKIVLLLIMWRHWTRTVLSALWFVSNTSIQSDSKLDGDKPSNATQQPATDRQNQAAEESSI